MISSRRDATIRAFRDSWPLSALLAAVYAFLATAIITNFDFRLLAPEDYGLVFNDMAQRLLRLDWAIDREVIGLAARTRAAKAGRGDGEVKGSGLCRRARHRTSPRI